MTMTESGLEWAVTDCALHGMNYYMYMQLMSATINWIGRGVSMSNSRDGSNGLSLLTRRASNDRSLILQR